MAERLLKGGAMSKNGLAHEIAIEAENIQAVRAALRKYAKQLRRAADAVISFLDGDIGVSELEAHFVKTGNDVCDPHAVVPENVRGIGDICPDPIEYAEYVNEAPERFKRIIEGK